MSDQEEYRTTGAINTGWANDVHTLAKELARRNVLIAETRKTLDECRRIPFKPFPDPDAHSWQTFANETWRAWHLIRIQIEVVIKRIDEANQ